MNNGRKEYENLSYLFGIIAMTASLLCCLYPVLGIIIGSLGVLFALLSRGPDDQLVQKAKHGILMSSTGIGINLLTILLAIFIIFGIPGNKEFFLQELNTQMQDIYGMDIYELWNEGGEQ